MRKDFKPSYPLKLSVCFCELLVNFGNNLYFLLQRLMVVTVSGVCGHCAVARAVLESKFEAESAIHLHHELGGRIVPDWEVLTNQLNAMKPNVQQVLLLLAIRCRQSTYRKSWKTN